MTKEWELTLPGSFNRRVEEGNLVIWRPGLTFWIAVWGNDHASSSEARLADLRRDASPQRENERSSSDASVLRYSYELKESDPGRTPTSYVALYSFSVAPGGHVQLAAYCDGEADLQAAYGVAQSVSTVNGATIARN